VVVPVCLFLAAVAAWAQSAPATIYVHVATNGSDQWSGLVAAPDPSGADGPLATIEHARDLIRDYRRSLGGTLTQPITVLVHGGTYRLRTAIQFTPADSGSPGAPVTYAANPGEQAVLSGGRAVTGWKEVDVAGRKLWAAVIPEARAGAWYFRQLWVNGQRRPRARHPNDNGLFKITGIPDYDPKAAYTVGQNRFQFAPGEIAQYGNLPDVELVLLMRWLGVRMGIAAVDETRHIVTLDRTTPQSLAEQSSNPPVFARYYVENALELLDAPGEWYLDRASGTLYYMPMPGEDMATLEAVAPVLDQLLVVAGDPNSGAFVENLNFSGLTFAHTGWWIPPGQAGARYQMQGAIYVPAAIQLDAARHVAFDQVTVAHTSNYAIHFSAGCSENRVSASELYDLGAGGIKIGEPIGNNQIPAAARVSHHIEVSDNHIHDLDLAYHQAHAVWIGPSHDNTVVHNHIHDLYYSAISVGWTWGYGTSVAARNLIAFNHVHDVGKNWLSDLGAVYTLGIQPGTEIHDNLFHDVTAPVYGGRGVYLDEGSSQVRVYNNLVYNTTHGLFTQNYGQDNVVSNNIFAFGRNCQIEPSGNMSKAQGLPNSFTFESNIVLLAPGEKMLLNEWNQKTVTMRRNLYWQGGSPIQFGRFSWAQWQAQGFDAGSVVADPLFADPVHYDFTLKDGSPAAKIGFQPFPALVP
jgi:hypothetical protein